LLQKRKRDTRNLSKITSSKFTLGLDEWLRHLGNPSPKARRINSTNLPRNNNRCLRRLNANLQFLAGLADRKNKLPPCPAILSSPPLNLTLEIRAQPDGPDESADQQKIEPAADRHERDKQLKELYKKLQMLFPGIDPKKEPAYGNIGQQQQHLQQQRPMGNPQQMAQMQMQGQQKLAAMTGQASPGGMGGPGQRAPQMVAAGRPQAVGQP